MIFRSALLFAVTGASILFPHSASAALVLFTDQASYNAQLASLSLVNTEFANFDLLSTVGMGANFTEQGIGFSSTSSMRITSGTTSSASNFLGIDDNFAPEFLSGDLLTLTLPANARAVRLHIVTETIPDSLTFASLSVGGNSVDTIANGTSIADSFRSYFLGIVSDSGTINSAEVSFTGGGAFYRIDDVGVAGFAQSVPEPTSSALVFLVGVSCLARRRCRPLATSEL